MWRRGYADQNLAEFLACLEKNADICSMMDYLYDIRRHDQPHISGCVSGIHRMPAICLADKKKKDTLCLYSAGGYQTR